MKMAGGSGAGYETNRRVTLAEAMGDLNNNLNAGCIDEVEF